MRAPRRAPAGALILETRPHAASTTAAAAAAGPAAGAGAAGGRCGYAALAAECMAADPALRPTMLSILKRLEALAPGGCDGAEPW